MSEVTYTVCDTDGCHKNILTGPDNEGWTFDGLQDFCPDCSALKEQEKPTEGELEDFVKSINEEKLLMEFQSKQQAIEEAEQKLRKDLTESGQSESDIEEALKWFRAEAEKKNEDIFRRRKESPE